MGKWHWVYHDEDSKTKLYDVGILADGTLHNPRGYPENVVRAAVSAAEDHRRERKSKAAKKAAETRRDRKALRVWQIAKRICSFQEIGSRRHCYVCGRQLDDPESIMRGIGSECWQDVLSKVESLRTSEAAK